MDDALGVNLIFFTSSCIRKDERGLIKLNFFFFFLFLIIKDECTEDIYGNQYNVVNFFQWTSGSNIFFVILLMLYFNIKSYLICWNLKSSIKLVDSRRRLKLVLLTFLNICHILFYFLEKDRVIDYNMCNLFRTFFMLIVVDFSFDILIKITLNIFSHLDVFCFFVGLEFFFWKRIFIFDNFWF